MAKFVGRNTELRELDYLLEERSVMAVVYGRRRIGKTTLLLEWMQRNHRAGFYWMAKSATPEILRHNFAAALWQWAYGDELAASTEIEPPFFQDWGQLFREWARLIDQRNQPVIAILDEFAFAVESDRSLPSFLQEAWDHYLKDKPLTLILAGSHIGMMIDLAQYKQPLYGRITARLPIDPLPYASIQDFLPNYLASERLATYSILGGVPAYLERFKDDRSTVENIREQLFRRIGFFRSEPDQLLGELARDSGRYLSILRAIAEGKHITSDIAGALRLHSGDITPYLKRLRDMHFVGRKLPVSLADDQREHSARGRYFLRDAYLRFYYRFVERNADRIEQGLTELVWQRINEQLRAYIGMGAFEEICRDWVRLQAQKNALPFMPESIGSEWNSAAQIDVAAINHREKQLLLGECKWSADRVRRNVITELVYDKTPKVKPAHDWTIHYVWFARAGFTPDALDEIRQHNGLAVSFEQVDDDLRQAFVAD
ncbi:MAG: ATP-binding protein [Anaerolineae bacterium]|nr:ATP-binding protein [Anaerolineae bacterium]